MKTTIFAAGLALAASMSSSAGTPGETTSQFSAAPNAPSRQLVQRFVEAYASQDAAALARTITKDFTAHRYTTLSASETTVTVEGLSRSWQQQPSQQPRSQQSRSMPSAHAGPTSVSVYPTPEAHTLFVAYRIAGQPADRIALLDLRGDRVLRIRDYPGSNESAPPANAGRAMASN